MAELKDYREKIDKIDEALVALFKERMEVALEIAKCKKERNLPILNMGREREIISKVTEQSGEELAMYAKILYSVLFDVSRSYQSIYLTDTTGLSRRIANALEVTSKEFPKKAVVACQGVEGAYSQQACDKLFAFPSIMYFTRFEGVFQAVETGMCKYGILPIDNSLYGTVNEVYDLMKKYSFFITRSIKLKLSHCLLTKKGTKLEDIREIFSHEQAIGQCSEFLKTLKNVKVTVCANTAEAAKMISDCERKDVAAISSSNCAKLYGLSILCDNIQNSDNNYTRFICISKDLEIYPGANKISLMMTVPHQPGSLYTTISKFSALGLNLTKLESRPILGSDFEFMFYLDMDASIYSKEVIKLLGEFENSADTFVFLGSYYET